MTHQVSKKYYVGFIFDRKVIKNIDALTKCIEYKILYCIAMSQGYSEVLMLILILNFLSVFALQLIVHILYNHV